MARPRDLPDRGVVQPARRRPAGRARPKGEVRGPRLRSRALSLRSLPRLLGRAGRGRRLRSACGFPLPNPPPQAGEGTRTQCGGEDARAAALEYDAAPSAVSNKMLRKLGALTILFVAFAAPARAADYPTKPVTLLVAFTPGGPSHRRS